jgi:DNA-binding response OmpR family regulator
MLKLPLERFRIVASIHPGSERIVSSLDYKRGDETILLVEDEELLCHVVVDMLTCLGYRVLGATSGKQAIALAQQHSGKIDVLITDVLIPDLAGPQLADSLRSSRPELKVIFVSGDAEASRLVGLGDATLQKPFTIKMLAAKLREVLER